MAPSLPSQFELRCAGISLISVSILWIIAFWLKQVDHDLYNIATNESVIKLHDKVSSPEHRLKIEVSCVLLWISFPLSLAAIHGIKKMTSVISSGTPAELLTYIAEKAFILAIGICLVLLPALSLTSVSFDWNYETATSQNEDGSSIAPQSYWIQLYLILYEIEIMDCIAICDATFMLSYVASGIYFRYAVWKGTNEKFVKLNQMARGMGGGYNSCKYAMEILLGFFCCSLTIVFVMVLLEFAESGFFSVTGNINAGMLVMWSFICKLSIGMRYIQGAKDERYAQLKRLFAPTGNDDGIGGNDDQTLVVQTKPYKMETIDVDQDLEKGVATNQ